MTNSFSAQVGAWASQTQARITAVRRRAIEMLAEEMARTRPQGGRVPFVTGNLARSLLASTAGMPRTSMTLSVGSNVGVVTATLAPDQVIWLGYQAIYARRVNYGYIGADALGRVYNQAGAHFVEGAIAQWQEIVARAAREIQASGSGA